MNLLNARVHSIIETYAPSPKDTPWENLQATILASCLLGEAYHYHNSRDLQG